MFDCLYRIIMYMFDKNGDIQYIEKTNFHSEEDYYIYLFKIRYGIVYTYDQYSTILEQTRKQNIQYLSINDASISDNHSICKIKYI